MTHPVLQVVNRMAHLVLSVVVQDSVIVCPVKVPLYLQHKSTRKDRFAQPCCQAEDVKLCRAFWPRGETQIRRFRPLTRRGRRARGTWHTAGRQHSKTWTHIKHPEITWSQVPRGVFPSLSPASASMGFLCRWRSIRTGQKQWWRFPCQWGHMGHWWSCPLSGRCTGPASASPILPPPAGWPLLSKRERWRHRCNAATVVSRSKAVHA